MGNFIAIITLGCFCVLASYAQGVRIGHLHAQRHSTSASTKMVYVWRNKKAAMLADVWNLTPDTLDSAVDILGRRR